jgi:hypothetical protein
MNFVIEHLLREGQSMPITFIWQHILHGREGEFSGASAGFTAQTYKEFRAKSVDALIDIVSASRLAKIQNGSIILTYIVVTADGVKKRIGLPRKVPGSVRVGDNFIEWLDRNGEAAFSQALEDYAEIQDQDEEETNLNYREYVLDPTGWEAFWGMIQDVILASSKMPNVTYRQGSGGKSGIRVFLIDWREIPVIGIRITEKRSGGFSVHVYNNPRVFKGDSKKDGEHGEENLLPTPNGIPESIRTLNPYEIMSFINSYITHLESLFRVKHYRDTIMLAYEENRTSGGRN